MTGTQKAVVLILMTFFICGALSEFAKHEGCIAFCGDSK